MSSATSIQLPDFATNTSPQLLQDIKMLLSKSCLLAEERNESLRIIRDQNADIIALLQSLTITTEAQSTGPVVKKGHGLDVEKIMNEIKDDDNYNSAAIRKMLNLSPTISISDMKKVIPGKWQVVGNHTFMNGSALKEALNSSDFFRNR